MDNFENTPVESHAEWALRKQREAMRVTRFQAKAALMQAGLLDAIETAVEMSSDPLVKLAWKEAGFERLSPFVAQMRSSIGLTDTELDSLFLAAAQVL